VIIGATFRFLGSQLGFASLTSTYEKAPGLAIVVWQGFDRYRTILFLWVSNAAEWSLRNKISLFCSLRLCGEYDS
jgi:hypothetical protein